MTSDGSAPVGLTPSQTVGPFFAYCLTPASYAVRSVFSGNLVQDGVEGERIRIEGTILDGDEAPVPDAMIEIWQADGRGWYPAHGTPINTPFRGFGRTECDREGRFTFATVKPGPVPGPNGANQAPHVNVSIFARGLLRHLFTRIYFEDEPSNAGDPILALVPPERRATLLARKAEEGVYTFVVRLQGGAETVFFEA
jgi:protocatechuate 3,4-dioxygenase alpha subunit